MPTDSRAFFSSRTPAGEYKHRVLQTYLRVWAMKLQSRRRRVVFVDACAGRGRYDDGEPGSPLIAAELNDQRYLTGPGATLFVVACEKDPGLAADLRENLRPFTDRDPPVAAVLEGPFPLFLAELASLTRDMPTLFLIDPYGPSDLSIDNLAPITALDRSEPTEAIIRINPRDLGRMSGQLARKDRETDRGRRTAESFSRLLHGLDIDPSSLDEGPEPGIGVRAMALWARRFERRFKYAQLWPVWASYSGKPQYFLLHGTDSEHGMAYMNDAISLATDELFVASGVEGQASLFEASEERLRISLSDVQAAIIAFVALRGRPTEVQIRAQAEGPRSIPRGESPPSPRHRRTVREHKRSALLFITPPRDSRVLQANSLLVRWLRLL